MSVCVLTILLCGTIPAPARAEAAAAVGVAYALLDRAAPVSESAGSLASAQQLDQIRDLAKATGWNKEQATAYLASVKSGPKERFDQLSRTEAEHLVAELQRWQRDKTAYERSQLPATCTNGSCRRRS